MMTEKAIIMNRKTSSSTTTKSKVILDLSPFELQIGLVSNNSSIIDKSFLDDLLTHWMTSILNQSITSNNDSFLNSMTLQSISLNRIEQQSRLQLQNSYDDNLNGSWRNLQSVQQVVLSIVYQGCSVWQRQQDNGTGSLSQMEDNIFTAQGDALTDRNQSLLRALQEADDSTGFGSAVSTFQAFLSPNSFDSARFTAVKLDNTPTPTTQVAINQFATLSPTAGVSDTPRVPTGSTSTESPTLQITAVPFTQLATSVPTAAATPAPSAVATPAPIAATSLPTVVTSQPTATATTPPSSLSTLVPTISPSEEATTTVSPTASLSTFMPTFVATTQTPTQTPVASTEVPTELPITSRPTHRPSRRPTRKPTDSPTLSTTDPTQRPTDRPSTLDPTSGPSQEPSIATDTPTAATLSPSLFPTDLPTTLAPTRKPSHPPTKLPTKKPTNTPSTLPSTQPSRLPSYNPTLIPTTKTNHPTLPSRSPSFVPSEVPSVLTESPLYRGLNITLYGLSSFNGAAKSSWTTVTQTYITDFFLNHTDLNVTIRGVIVTVDSFTPRQRSRTLLSNRRGLQSGNPAVVVSYSEEFEYKSESSSITATRIVALPFEGDTSLYVERLKEENPFAFSSLTSTSAVTIPDSNTNAITGGTKTHSGGLSKAAVIAIGAGCGVLALALLAALFDYLSGQRGRRYKKRINSKDEDDDDVPFTHVQLGYGDEISTLEEPQTPASAAVAGRAGTNSGSVIYRDQSVATVDYEYTKAYGGIGNKTVSSAGGTFGSNTQGNAEITLAAAAAGAAQRSSSSQQEGNLSDSDDSHYRGLGAVAKEVLIDIYAPPGKLGVVIDTPDDGAPVIHGIKDSSVVADELQVGDKLVAVDDEDVRSMSAIKVSKLISRASENPSRKLTVLRTVVEE